MSHYFLLLRFGQIFLCPDFQCSTWHSFVQYLTAPQGQNLRIVGGIWTRQVGLSHVAISTDTVALATCPAKKSRAAALLVCLVCLSAAAGPAAGGGGLRIVYPEWGSFVLNILERNYITFELDVAEISTLIANFLLLRYLVLIHLIISFPWGYPSDSPDASYPAHNNSPINIPPYSVICIIPTSVPSNINKLAINVLVISSPFKFHDEFLQRTVLSWCNPSIYNFSAET